MMRKFIFKYRLILLAGAIAIFLTACSDDFFERTSGDRITPDQHYKDLIDGDISMQGAIISMQEALPRMILLDGLRSDAMVVTGSADQYLREIRSHIFSEYNPYTTTSDFYKVIINLNEVMAHLDELAENDRDLDDYFKYYVRGELLAMRAWVYFTVARIHGEVTYLPDNMESLPDELIEPWPKDVIIDTLINQLMPYIYDPTAGQEKVEIEISHYVNPKAILGEMLLEQGDYANAITYLKMACESYGNSNNVYKVDNTYKDDAWASIFLNAEYADAESFSVMPYNSREKQNNPLALWLGRDFDFVVKPSQVLVDSFMAQKPATGDPGDYYRGLGISFGVDTLSKTSETVFETENYILKYHVDAADPAGTDIIMQRATDIHLLLAEAYNRLGGEDGEHYALMFLNYGVADELPKPAEYTKWSKNVGVRGRVSLSLREVPESLAGEQRVRYIEDLIMQERAMEMAFEGKRWFDLVRVAERRGDASYLADKVAAKYEDAALAEAVRSRLMNPENWYIPPR